MASDKALSAVLAVLQECFPSRDVSPATLDAWAVVFAEWTDDELQRCAMAAARERGRVFFPTPGEIAAHRPAPALDLEAVLSRISALGTYSPHVGWCLPRVEAVRRELGDAIADAYGAVGGAQLFAGESSDGQSISRDIARRAFAKDLTEHVRRNPDVPLISAPASPLALESNTKRLNPSEPTRAA